MSEPIPDRILPLLYVRSLLHATEEQIGVYSLQMLIYQAGLVSESDRLPISLLNVEVWLKQRQVRASELAALQAAFRQYFGSGARGALNRIGRSAWALLLREATLPARTGLLAARLMPASTRRKLALEFLADMLRAGSDDISVHSLDLKLIFQDRLSDLTYGQHSTMPICWSTLGLLQAALAWSTDEPVDVTEIDCRAMGADACRFQISIVETG